MNRREALQSLLAAGSSLVLAKSKLYAAETTGTPLCYTQEWKRSRPDYVLYHPPEPLGDDGDNEHLLIVETPKGDLLAFWCQGEYEMSRDYRIVSARSQDGGTSWTKPEMVVGPTEHRGFTAAWPLPIVSRAGRIYLFYFKNTGIADMSYTTTGIWRCLYSGDDGHSFQDGGEIPLRRREKHDHPDPEVPKNVIIWQPAIRDANGRFLAGFTRWSSPSRFPMANGPDGWYPDSRSEFVRFENIDEGPLPRDLKLTWLPEGDAISVPCPFEPHKSRGYSLAEEPAVVLLPDGRLFAAMRTITGRLWYSVSEDATGRNWSRSESLRFHDEGAVMLHPKNTAPLYRLLDGRYILFFQNHDGTGYGAKGAGDMEARSAPMFYSVGEFRPRARQPIWFSEPRVFCDVQKIAIGPGNGSREGGRTWLSFYGCMTFARGKQVLWYPDRKHFLLGKQITPAMLEGMKPPP